MSGEGATSFLGCTLHSRMKHSLHQTLDPMWWVHSPKGRGWQPKECRFLTTGPPRKSYNTFFKKSPIWDTEHRVLGLISEIFYNWSSNLEGSFSYVNEELFYDLKHAAAAAKSLQLCPTLCNAIDGSPPGSPVPGILQARTLEWVAISFSNA